MVVNGKPLIYIKNRDDPNKVYPPISTDNAYFSQYMWANNDRLLGRSARHQKFGNRLLIINGLSQLATMAQTLLVTNGAQPVRLF